MNLQKDYQGGAIKGLVRALEAHGDVTRYAANDRVAAVARVLATKVGRLTDDLIVGAMLHDVGKLAIPDSILNKNGPLTPAERTVMQKHVLKGWEMIVDCELPGVAALVAAQHHENWDGTGYPSRLPGSNCCVEARIVKIADAYEAMVVDRVYRKRRSHDDAVRELRRCAGTEFDPELVEAFAGLSQRQLAMRLRAA